MYTSIHDVAIQLAKKVEITFMCDLLMFLLSSFECRFKKKDRLTHFNTFCALIRRIKCFSPLNAELNPICHLLALLGAHHIFHVSGLKVKETNKRT